MGLSARMQAVAAKLLNKFDESDSADRRIKLIRKPTPVWDDIEKEYIHGTSETVDLTGVTVPFTQSQVNGTTIQSGDVTVIATADEMPTMEDKLEIDGEQWSIVSRPLVEFSGVAIVYKMQARK